MRTVKIRPKWYSMASVPALCGVVGSVVVAFAAKSHGVLGVTAIGVAAWVISMYGTTIEVTPTDVGVRLWFFGRRSAPRDEIGVMHWGTQYITFSTIGNVVVLRCATYGWTGSQVVELSEALGVPLYNHRTKRGWGKDAKTGTLMKRTANIK